MFGLYLDDASLLPVVLPHPFIPRLPRREIPGPAARAVGPVCGHRAAPSAAGAQLHHLLVHRGGLPEGAAAMDRRAASLGRDIRGEAHVDGRPLQSYLINLFIGIQAS